MMRVRRLVALRAAAYGIATALALLGIVWMLIAASRRESTSAQNGNLNGARVTSSTHDLFEEAYELGWRADGAAGNTAVEAVYYFPSLLQRLNEYAERSALQAQTLASLESAGDESLTSFVITLTSNGALDSGFNVKGHVSLVADGSPAYSAERWVPFTLSEGVANQLAGLLSFRRPEGAPAPQALTVTFKDIPGNIQPTVFSWNATALSLDNPDPSPSS